MYVPEPKFNCIHNSSTQINLWDELTKRIHSQINRAILPPPRPFLFEFTKKTLCLLLSAGLGIGRPGFKSSLDHDSHWVALVQSLPRRLTQHCCGDTVWGRTMYAILSSSREEQDENVLNKQNNKKLLSATTPRPFSW